MSNPSQSPLTSDSQKSTANKLSDILDSENDNTSEVAEIPDIDDVDSGIEENEEEVPENSETDDSGTESEADTEGVDELDIDPDDVSLQMPVTMKKVLAKYPDLKKDFPELIASNFREKEYSELFPTVSDAKEAVEKVATLEKFTEVIFGGDVSPILAIVQKDDPRAFGQIVNNYLPNLHKVSPEAADYVVNDVLNRTLHRAFGIGNKMENEDLKAAAKIMYNFVFGEGSPSASFGKQEPETEAMQAVKKERESFEQSRHDTHVTETMTKVQNSIKAQIDKSIDPKGTMSPYVKRNAVNDAYTAIMDNMKGDKRFTAITDGMWKKAKESKYEAGTIEPIKKAYYGRFRQVATELINKVRSEALKGMSNTKAKEDTKFKVRESAATKSKNESRKMTTSGKDTRSTFDKLGGD